MGIKINTGIEERRHISGAFSMCSLCRRKYAAKAAHGPCGGQGDDRPGPIAANQKEGGGVLAREKISDSLLDGFRTESN